MNALAPIIDLVHRGGPVMFAIMALSVVLYARCMDLLLFLARSRRAFQAEPELSQQGLARVRWLQNDWHEHFMQQRVTLGAMIAAAPLLGLLGTVNGMIGTFESLSRVGGDKSMEGLASGISEVLVATESGLVVAIPAVLVVYYAHRQTQKGLQHLNEIEARIRAAL